MAERTHTAGPWFVELTATAGLRVVHGEPDAETGFRSDVPTGLGKVGPTDEERANVTLKAAAPQLLDSLLAVEFGGSDFTEDADEFECCPADLFAVAFQAPEAIAPSEPRVSIPIDLEDLDLPTLLGEPEPLL